MIGRASIARTNLSKTHRFRGRVVRRRRGPQYGQHAAQLLRMSDRQRPLAGLQLRIAFNPTVVPQDTVHAKAIESRGLAAADLQRKGVLARGIDDRRAPVRLSPAASDFLLAAVHLEGHGHHRARRTVAKRDLVSRNIMPLQVDGDVEQRRRRRDRRLHERCGRKVVQRDHDRIDPYVSSSFTRTGSSPSRTVATGTVF